MLDKTISYVFVFLVAAIILSGCSRADKFYLKTGFLMWGTFADNLDTGSSVPEDETIITKDGDVEVTMIKAEHPSPDENSSDFPFAGIFFGFNKSRKPVDLSGYNRILLNYRLSGQLSLLLSQTDIPAGEEYQVDLPVSEKYMQIVFNWDDFIQPEWVEHPKPLNLEQITGVKFKITDREKTRTEFGMKSFEFE